MSSTYGRVAIIGDVGGHHDELYAALVTLGMNPSSGELPDDLTVVQVGDTIHRGPMSEQVVHLIDHILHTQREQWAQIVGNHEQLYVAEPVFEWNETINDEAAETLRQWWATGLMSPAVAVQTDSGADWLITHAGLTTGFWRRIGSPVTASDAAAAINAVDRDPHRGALWRAGAMLNWREPTLQAGPVWASAPTELLPGWCGPNAEALPFHQVHGHSCELDWGTGRHYGNAHVAQAVSVDNVRRHVIALAGDHVIVGVDPNHGARPAPSWAPFVIHGARVTVR